MKQWSADVVLLTDGPSQISAKCEARLQRHQILICSEQIAALEGTDDGELQFIRLRGGKTLKRNALFFTTGCRQASELSASLGCVRDEKGGIVADPVTGESSVPGVYVAGDASRDVLLVAVAIGEGAKAGYDRPTPMPGVHGGGGPAKAFSAMTDFHYLRLARAQLITKREPKDEWSELRSITPAEPLRSALVFGAILAMCLMLTRKPRHVGEHSAAPLPADDELVRCRKVDPRSPQQGQCRR